MGDSAVKHTILGGMVHVCRRENSVQWQASTHLVGRNHRVSMKSASLAQAKEFAKDWDLTLRQGGPRRDEDGENVQGGGGHLRA